VSPTSSPGLNPYASLRPIEGTTIAALVLGLFSPFAAQYYGIPGIVLGSIAVFLGLRARRRIKESAGVLGGGGIAMAGWIAGVCGIVAGLVWGLFLLALYMAMVGGGGGGGKG
jgi:hypothetical protein